MDTNLLKMRVISFAYGAGTLMALAVVAVLASDQMQSLISEHFGTGFFGTVISLLVIELVKHIRNLKVLKDAKLGGEGKNVILI